MLIDLLKFWWSPTSKRAFDVLIRALCKMNDHDLREAIGFSEAFRDQREKTNERVAMKGTCTLKVVYDSPVTNPDGDG